MLTTWYGGVCSDLSLAIRTHADDDRHIAALVQRCRTIEPLWSSDESLQRFGAALSDYTFRPGIASSRRLESQ